MPTPRILKILKILKTKHVKKCSKKCQQNIFFKTPFGALPKIGDWICKFFKIGLKKCYSLKITE